MWCTFTIVFVCGNVGVTTPNYLQPSVACAATALVALVTRADLLAILMAISPVMYSQAYVLTK